jgi:3-(methylthio)propionyl---CoA ligase
MLRGQMMNRPLSIPAILDYAAELFPELGIVSVMPDGGIKRQGYVETRRRVAQLAHALKKLGVREGDRVATLAWNTHRHFEIYYATAAIGAVCHTINPRLPVSQIDFIMKHAGDALLFHDVDLANLAAEIPYATTLDDKVVVLGSAGDASSRRPAYESLLAEQPEEFEWLELDESAACGLCYTSGTTGEPKGALYSHRSAVLIAMMTIVSRMSSWPAAGKFLPVVPMFHVNAWGLPYSVPMSGGTLVMPGNRLDGESLFKLMDAEEVCSAWGVPTVWYGLLDAMDRHGRKPSGFAEIIVGGSAASGQLIERFEQDYGVAVKHAWGMTEMSPIGTGGMLMPDEQALGRKEKTRLQLSQGRRLFGVEMKIADDNGNRLPADGQHDGELMVRGPTVISGYYRNPRADSDAFDKNGWFRTGDRARLGPRGRLTLIDRIKDLIKSGGEWISSIDLEEAAMRHPDVAMCAAIGVPHEKWGERPVLVVVPRNGQSVDAEELTALMAGSVAKWQLPDRILFREALPMTGTGKVSKLELRRLIATELGEQA